jgi:N6-adenosine-specific RNA methylase IME4
MTSSSVAASRIAMNNSPASLLVADPPWPFGDKLPGKSRGAERNYDVMSVDAIGHFLETENIRVQDDAVLLLWRVSSMIEEALRVTRMWGFVPKSEIVWVKTTPSGVKLHFGMGRYVRAAHEACIVAARGKAVSLVQSHSLRSVIVVAPTGEHSEKPDAFYLLAEDLFPGPRVELFARKPREGWIQYGRELGKIPA